MEMGRQLIQIIHTLIANQSVTMNITIMYLRALLATSGIGLHDYQGVGKT